MLKKREGVTEEEALKIACEKNGLRYNPGGSGKSRNIIVQNEKGELVSIDKDYNVTPITEEKKQMVEKNNQ